MFDDLAAYFVENVFASYDEYRRVRQTPTAGLSKDIRLAIHAATALYHLRERMPDACKKTRTALGRTCPDYDLLGDVVNAAKHHKLDRRGRTPLIASAESIFEELVVTEYADDNGAYRHNTKVIAVDLVDGSRRDLFDVLTNVLNMWMGELEIHRIIAPMARIPVPSRLVPPSRSEARGHLMELVAMQGVRFRFRMRLLRHNYATGVAEPIDLTGYTGGAQVYRPTETIDLTLRNDATGHEVTRSVTIAGSDAIEFRLLATDEQRQAFLNALFERRGIWQQLRAAAELPSESE